MQPLNSSTAPRDNLISSLFSRHKLHNDVIRTVILIKQWLINIACRKILLDGRSELLLRQTRLANVSNLINTENFRSFRKHSQKRDQWSYAIITRIPKIENIIIHLPRTVVYTINHKHEIYFWNINWARPIQRPNLKISNFQFEAFDVFVMCI